jgi:hypothetical protein
MVYLGYGNSGSTGLRTEYSPIPRPRFKQYDAGPNVIVVYSVGCLEDYLLLWNLRSAHGDRFVLPIGVPVDEASAEAIRRLALHPARARNGMPVRSAYLTSTSVSQEALSDLASTAFPDRIESVAMNQMLTFGRPGGWVREEVLVLDNGRTRFVPLPSENHREILTERSFHPHTRMYVDIEVPDQPFPNGPDI